MRQELGSERFADATPRTIYHRLLQEGRVLCHWRTMYRLLRADNASHERRRMRRRPTYAKPELLATAPNQVWSWDITMLRGPRPAVWYRLYLVLDSFSRMVVGWVVAEHETAEQAEHLLADADDREGVAAHQLTIHANRGAAMTSQTVAELLLDLGVTGFVTWYNTEHYHSGIGFLTPEQHHRGAGVAITAARQAALDAAYAAHPERFVRGRPQAPQIPTAAWINPPTAHIVSSVAPASPPNPAGGQGSQPPQRPLDAQTGSAMLPGDTSETKAWNDHMWS